MWPPRLRLMVVQAKCCPYLVDSSHMQGERWTSHSILIALGKSWVHRSELHSDLPCLNSETISWISPCRVNVSCLCARIFPRITTLSMPSHLCNKRITPITKSLLKKVWLEIFKTCVQVIWEEGTSSLRATCQACSGRLRIILIRMEENVYCNISVQVVGQMTNSSPGDSFYSRGFARRHQGPGSLSVEGLAQYLPPIAPPLPPPVVVGRCAFRPLMPLFIPSSFHMSVALGQLLNGHARRDILSNDRVIYWKLYFCILLDQAEKTRFASLALWKKKTFRHKYFIVCRACRCSSLQDKVWFIRPEKQKFTKSCPMTVCWTYDMKLATYCVWEALLLDQLSSAGMTCWAVVIQLLQSCYELRF